MLSKNEIFKFLVENSFEGLALFENRELVYASESMNKIFGCADFKKFQNYPDVLARVHPDDFPAIEKMYSEGIEKKLKTQRYQYRFKRDDGNYCWIENSVTRFFDDAGENFRNIIICRDITGLKNAETELLESRQIFKTIADSTTAFIYIKDLAGRYTFCNRALEKVYDCAPGQMDGKTDFEITDAESAEKFRKNDLTILERGVPKTFEETQKLDDGLHTAVSVKVPLRDYIGKINAVCGITTDITERKKAEQQLRDLKDKLELALQVGKMGIWEWYVEGNRVEWYADHAKLFGISNEEFGGTPEDVRKRVHPEDRSKGIEAFKKSINENIPYDLTFRVIWPDKSLHWLSSLGNPVIDENGKAIKITGITRDVTVEKQSRDKIISQNRELSRINATKDKLFSIISHDLMNPLNSLLGFTQLLRMHYRNESTEKIGQYANLISRSANAMADLLQTLSQWSKSQRHKIKVSPGNIKPAKLIIAIHDLLYASLQNKNLKLVNNLSEDHISFADEDMVKTILRNILTNAIKFSHPGGIIQCSGEIRNGNFVFKVSDSGTGIRPEKLKTIFNISENGSETGTAGEKGSGLGLIICKELAELNHGKIWAESERGKGADFYLEIPADKDSWDTSKFTRNSGS